MQYNDIRATGNGTTACSSQREERLHAKGVRRALYTSLTLLATCALFAGAHHSGYRLVAKTAYVHVYTKSAFHESYYTRIANIIEETAHFMRHELKTSPDAPLTLYLTRTSEEFRTLTGFSAQNAAIYKGGVLYLQNPETLLRRRMLTEKLRHEYFHHLFECVGREGLPYWLEEALCLYYSGETPRVVGIRIPATTDALTACLSSNTREEMHKGYAGAYLFISHIAQTKGSTYVANIVSGKTRDADALSAAYRTFASARRKR